MTFQVQKKQCSTCIYRKDSALDLKTLEAACKDQHGYFKGFRICHSAKTACCRGFWNKHKDEFPHGQIAQRLNLVEFVEDHSRSDLKKDIERSKKKMLTTS